MREETASIRERKPVSFTMMLRVSGIIALTGLMLGILQKWLDTFAVNDLPWILQKLDIINFFGRLGIWIFLAVLIAVIMPTPWWASLNTFLFLISMVAGYYLYCRIFLGFLPGSYMMIWITVSFTSLILGFLCWYAKGEGPVGILVTGGILGVLLAQAFILRHGIYMTHGTEAILWILAILLLRRDPKEEAVVLMLSVITAYLYQVFIPYWG